MEGMVIGNHRIVRKLGQGGMGAVYIAEHALIGRKAAIKVLLPALSANQDIVQRFFNEARAATAIQDAGIVQIFDFGYHTDGSAYIVMEFLEGETLDARLRRLGRMNPHDALRIMRQCATSLAAAHARGIIHRDLKPENIFLVRDAEVAGGERPKILDFGIAKLTGDTDSKVKTQTAAIMGTPWFMSPEQCRGAGQIDHRSDVYALGCVLFHLVTGTPPFDGEGAGDIIAQHLMVAPPSPSSRVPGIPPEVDVVVARCLAKLPDQRYGSMDELAAVLGQLVGFVTSPHGMQSGVGPPVSYIGQAHSQPPVSQPGTSPPTTLSSVASQVGLPVPALSHAGVAPAPKKKGLAIAIGAIAVAAVAAVAVIVVTGNKGNNGGGGGDDTTTPAATQASKPAPEPAAKVEPVVKPPEPVVKPPEPVVKPPEPVVKPPEPVVKVEAKPKKPPRPPKPPKPPKKPKGPEVDENGIPINRY